MNRSEKMNFFLRKLTENFDKYPERINISSIQKMLKSYGIKNSHIQTQIDYTVYFPYIIEKLQKKNNIKTEYDSYNGQLKISSGNKQKDNTFKIKLYLSINPKEMIPTIDALYNFISDNNIEQVSKIESRDRSDTIKIKLSKKEDAYKLINFINNNENIKQVSRETNPFLANVGVVGIGIENRISYNTTIAYLISKYLETKKNKNNSANISIEDFKDYLDRLFYNTFVSQAVIHSFLKDEYIEKNMSRIRNTNQHEERINEKALLDFMHSINAIRTSLLGKDDLDNILSVFTIANDIEFNEPQIDAFSEKIDLDYSKTALKRKEKALESFIEFAYNNCRDEEAVLEAVKKYYKVLPYSSAERTKKNKNHSSIDQKSIELITNGDIESFIQITIDRIKKETNSRK